MRKCALKISLCISLCISALISLTFGTLAQASVLDQAPTLSDAKSLATAVDIFLELPVVPEAQQAPAIDQARMRKGLTDGAARLDSRQFNELTQILIGKYLRNPGERRAIEGFLDELAKSANSEFHEKLSHMGVSAAEDALFFMALLAALHGTPYGYKKIAAQGPRIAGWLNPITRRFQGGALSRMLATEWREGRTLKGAITFLPRMLWTLMVSGPNEMWFKLLAQPINERRLVLYPLVAAAGVSHTLWETYQGKHLDPREALTLAQLKLLSDFQSRLSHFADPARTNRAAGSDSGVEPGFEEADVLAPEELAAEMVGIRGDLRHLSESSAVQVRTQAVLLMKQLGDD